MTLNTSEIKIFVDANIKKVKSIHSVSESMKISYDLLRKSFLRVEHIPLAEYITRKKIEAMKDLLLNADHPCFYICYEYGYREDSGAKVFKKFTGMTMLEFKNMYKNKSAIPDNQRNQSLFGNYKPN